MGKVAAILCLATVIVGVLPVSVWAGNAVRASIVADDTELIDVRLSEGSVNIYEIDGERITITGERGNRCKALKIDNLGKTVLVQQETNWFPVLLRRSQLFIGIPSDYKGGLSIYQGTGNLVIRDVTVSDITVETTATHIVVDDVQFDRLTVNSKTGVKTNQINLKRRSGDIQIAAGVWGFELNLKEIGGDLSFRGGTMGSRISIPPNAPVQIVEIGKKGSTIAAQTSGEHRYTLTLRKGVGGILLTNE